MELTRNNSILKGFLNGFAKPQTAPLKEYSPYDMEFSPRDRADLKLYELNCRAEDVLEIAELTPELISKEEMLQISFVFHKALAAMDGWMLDRETARKYGFARACR